MDNHLSSTPNAGAPGQALPASATSPAVPRDMITRLPTEVLTKIFSLAFTHFDARGHTRLRLQEYRSQADERLYRPVEAVIRHRVDLRTLKNLRLTCQSFEGLASNLLFRTVRLSYYRADLYNLVRIAFHPSLRTHVRALWWEETMAAVVFENTPTRIRTNILGSADPDTARESAAHQALLKSAWEQMCWNGAMVSGPGSSATTVDNVLSIIAAILRNLPRLAMVLSRPMNDLSGNPGTDGMYRDRHVPSLLPQQFADVDFSDPLHDRFFNLSKIGFYLHGDDKKPEYLNDGFFRFIVPALSRLGSSDSPSLQIMDERNVLGLARGRQGCLSRFRSLRPESFANLTFINFCLSFHAYLYDSANDNTRRYAMSVIRCIESATQLSKLELNDSILQLGSLYPKRNEPWRCTGHFFDFLVWGGEAEGGGPHGKAHANNPPGRRWEKLKSLRLEGVYCSQLSLLRFLAVHAQTITVLAIKGCAPLEFRTAREMSRMSLLSLDTIYLAPPAYLADLHPRPSQLNDDPDQICFIRDVEYIAPNKLLHYINNYKPARVGNLVSESSKWDSLGVPHPIPPMGNGQVSFLPDGDFVAEAPAPPEPMYSTANFAIRTAQWAPSSMVPGWWIPIDRERAVAADQLTQERFDELAHDEMRGWWVRDSEEDRDCWERIRDEGRAFDFRDWTPGQFATASPVFHRSFAVSGTIHPSEQSIAAFEGTIPVAYGWFGEQELRCVYAGLKREGSVEEEYGAVKERLDEKASRKHKADETQSGGSGLPVAAAAAPATTVTATAAAGPLVGAGPGAGRTLGVPRSSVQAMQGIMATLQRSRSDGMPQVFREHAGTLSRLLGLPGAEDDMVKLWREIKRLSRS
ncbi:hypothetical protein V8F06_013300 [Rhypophila decipiens]